MTNNTLIDFSLYIVVIRIAEALKTGFWINLQHIPDKKIFKKKST